MNEPPVVLGLSAGVTVGCRERPIGFLEELSDVPEGPGCLLPRDAQPRRQVVRERPALQELRRLIRERLPEVSCVALRDVDPVVPHHPVVRHVPRPDPVLQDAPHGAQERRNGQDATRDALPLLGRAASAVRKLGHLLDLPVHAPERSDHVGVDAPLVVMQVLEKVEHEPNLRAHHLAVDGVVGRQRGGIDSFELGEDRAVEDDLRGAPLLRDVRERRVDVGQLLAVAVSSKVGRRDRVPLQEADEIPLTDIGPAHAGVPSGAGERGREEQREEGGDGGRLP